jgi:hypothetical protein
MQLLEEGSAEKTIFRTTAAAAPQKDDGHAHVINLCFAESGSRSPEKRLTTSSSLESDAVAIQPPS